MKLKELLFGKSSQAPPSVPAASPPGSTQGWTPVADIRSGMVVTADGRFVKILEVLPVNFYMMPPAEQQSIIYYFSAWLKIAPDSLQILSVTQKADIAGYVSRMWEYHKRETDHNCRRMIEDNILAVERLAKREALTRRFFIAFQFEPSMMVREQTVEAIGRRLAEEAETARRYLDLCGLEVVVPRYSDVALCELLYGLLNKKESREVRLPESVFTMLGQLHGVDDAELSALETEGYDEEN